MELKKGLSPWRIFRRTQTLCSKTQTIALSALLTFSRPRAQNQFYPLVKPPAPPQGKAGLTREPTCKSPAR